MDKSLDDVCFITSFVEHHRLSLGFQIVAASRVVKHTRRGAGRRGNTARAQVLGAAVPSPVTKARLANTTKGTATTASPQPVEKIVVSNLPQDVNEAQVKVRRILFMKDNDEALTFVPSYRSFSRPRLDPCARSTSTTIQMAVPKAWPLSYSQRKGTATRPTSNTTIASSMGVSIRRLLSLELVFLFAVPRRPWTRLIRLRARASRNRKITSRPVSWPPGHK